MIWKEEEVMVENIRVEKAIGVGGGWKERDGLICHWHSKTSHVAERPPNPAAICC